MPNDETFIQFMKKMDIRKTDKIICYDRQGIFSSPRVWFTFMLFGAKEVSILNGGFPKWVSEQLPLEQNEEYNVVNQERTKPTSEDYEYKLDRSKIKDAEGILDLCLKKAQRKTDENIIDTRPPARYRGEVDEPRPCPIKGHLEGAVNVFFKDLLDENSCFKPVSELKKVFENCAVDLDKKLNFYCGSGTTASVGILAASQIGLFDNCTLYDGSWAEMVNIYFLFIRGI